MALPFLPIGEMEDYFTDILIPEMWDTVEISKYAKPVEVFCDYIVNQWVENPSLSANVWNIYDRGDDDRTNNACEFWHSKFNRRTNANHQHIFKYLKFNI